MRDHIRVLGILNIAMGAMVALIGVAVFFVTGAIAGYVASSVNMTEHDAIIAALSLRLSVSALPFSFGLWRCLR